MLDKSSDEASQLEDLEETQYSIRKRKMSQARKERKIAFRKSQSPEQIQSQKTGDKKRTKKNRLKS